MLPLRARNACANFLLRGMMKMLLVLVILVLERGNQRCVDLIGL